MDFGGWLRTLGLERYEAAFRENAVALDGACAAATSAPVLSAASASPTSSTVEVSGEWRHVTAVFCDLVDLTGIAAKLDPDEWRDLVEAYLDAASRGHQIGW